MTDKSRTTNGQVSGQGPKADGHGQGSIEPSVCPRGSQRHRTRGRGGGNEATTKLPSDARKAELREYKIRLNRPLSDLVMNDLSPARSLLHEVDERRSELEGAIQEARNGRERSPLRKEMWWLDQLSQMLRRWISEQRLRGDGQ